MSRCFLRLELPVLTFSAGMLTCARQMPGLRKPALTKRATFLRGYDQSFQPAERLWSQRYGTDSPVCWIPSGNEVVRRPRSTQENSSGWEVAHPLEHSSERGYGIFGYEKVEGEQAIPRQ